MLLASVALHPAPTQRFWSVQDDSYSESDLARSSMDLAITDTAELSGCVPGTSGARLYQAVVLMFQCVRSPPVAEQWHPRLRPLHSRGPIGCQQSDRVRNAPLHTYGVLRQSSRPSADRTFTSRYTEAAAIDGFAGLQWPRSLKEALVRLQSLELPVQIVTEPRMHIMEPYSSRADDDGTCATGL